MNRRPDAELNNEHAGEGECEKRGDQRLGVELGAGSEPEEAGNEDERRKNSCGSVHGLRVDEKSDGAARTTIGQPGKSI